MSSTKADRARPLFSVVMVTHNHVAYAEDAIMALFEQTYSDPFQIVVSDDASSDGTDALVNRMKSRAPDHVDMIVLDSRKHAGALRNFNRALRHSRGRFIVIADGDDISAPRRLERLASEVRSPRSLFISDVIDAETGMRRPGAPVLKRESFGVKDLAAGKRGFPILGAGFAFDARLLDQETGVNSFYATNHNADHALFWRAMVANGCQVVDEPLVRYREHAEGISLRRAEEAARDRGDWVDAFDFHLRRGCNRLGNLAYASDLLLASGHLIAWHKISAQVVAEANALCATLGCLDHAGHDGPHSTFCEIYDWSIDLLGRARSALAHSKSFAAIMTSRDLLLWAALSEGGLSDSKDLTALLKVQKLPAQGTLAFARRLLRLRGALERGPRASMFDGSALEKALAPSLEGSHFVYRGQRGPITLKAIQALPKRDFLIIVGLIAGERSSDADRREASAALLEGRIGKRGAFVKLIGGRLAALGLRRLPAMDRLRIALSPSRPPKVRAQQRR